MTCRMAAGQQKKRLTSSNLHEQCRGKKKKKIDSSDYVLNLTSHIDLEWNDNQKRAMAKQEQIGISWMDMTPFIDSLSQPHFGVADVISVPPEIFSLKNFNELLSYEVWATCLSESDRKLLAQFLPNGTGAEQVVHSLLDGDNHHFGNPFMKWFTSLQAGNLHPDVVLCKEKQFRASKIEYYSELKKYHTSLLEILMKWKEKWLSVKDPEKLLSDVYTKSKQGPIEARSERAKDPSILKKETPTRTSMHNGATDKYMSYIKISRAQHNLIKKMTQSGDGILSKSLSCVLGDIKCFPLQPYESFEEKEKQHLHEYWLQLVNKDLPKAFEVLWDRKLQRDEWKKSLGFELVEKKISLFEEDVNTQNLEISPQGAADDADNIHHSASNVEDESDSDSVRDTEDDQMLEGTSFNSNEPGPLTIQEESPSKRFKEESQKATLKPEDDFSPISQSLSQSPNNNIMEPQGSMSSTKDMWQAATLHDSHYHSPPNNHGYKSAGELSLSQPQFNLDYSSQVIDLEKGIMKPEAQSEAPLFCSYTKQDQNDMLPAFPKAPDMLPYPHEHMNGIEQSGLPFLMTNDSLPESSQFPNQCQQQRLLEQREAATRKDLYVNQIMHKNFYSPSKYPSQGQIPSVDQQSFVVLQPSASTSSVGYNWFPSENQAYNSWSGVDSSNTGNCVGDVGNSDGSLYSVLNNELPMCPPPYSTGDEQYAQVRNFIGGMPNAHNIYGYAPPQLNNSSPHDAAGPTSLNGESWMNAPHQNPTLHDSLGRLFRRPWDQ